MVLVCACRLQGVSCFHHDLKERTLGPQEVVRILGRSLLLIVVVLLYEGICDLLAAVQWRYQDQKCASRNQKAQIPGALVSFLVCEESAGAFLTRT